MHHYFDKQNKNVWFTTRRTCQVESYFQFIKEAGDSKTVWRNGDDVIMTSFYVSRIFLDVMFGGVP